MLVISLELTLFVFVLLPLSGIIISGISKKLKAKSLLAQQETGIFLSFIEETLSGLKIIKGFNAESRIAQKFMSSTNKFRKLMNSVVHRKVLASPMSEFLGSATIIVILWYGGQLVLSDESDLKPEQFLTYIGLFYLILSPAKLIASAFYKIQKGDASAQRILSILEAPIAIKDKPNSIYKETFEHSITFENVSFKYEDAYVLRNFSLTIKKGQTVALVGPSGSGKSTIANLLPRFYDIKEGAIKIDGIDIRELKQHDLRKLIGLVTQDSVLFNDTIKNNLCLSVAHATNEEIIEATKVANAYEFIKDLPGQLENNIGDSGNKLSGGQKQRLNIARAILKNPEILILDEATSALDNESEKLVQDALEKMTKNSTSLVIAHRLSTIQNADHIVVMKNGKIVEQGVHKALLEQKGTYFNMLNSHSRNSSE
jgi:subfamily B ATP-binding cassette protein MsbA